jgi:GTP-binding protein
MNRTNLHDNSSINTRQPSGTIIPNIPAGRIFPAEPEKPRSRRPSWRSGTPFLPSLKRIICIAVQLLVATTKISAEPTGLLSPNMNIQSAVFEVSSPTLDLCPRLALPEFAFIGRSNVGKSSLINMLTEKATLAKVSDLPGKTRLMNFFIINRSWRLVDLPGYGYAHVAQNERADFNEAVADYLRGRENLAGVFVLIDSRHEPQAIDIDFIEWLVDNEILFALVFTKIDKQSASQTQLSMTRFKQTVLADLDPIPTIFASSAKAKTGRNDILRYVSERL